MWPKIVSLGLVVSAGEKGVAKLYRFNEESPLAKMLVKMSTEFALTQVEKEIMQVPVAARSSPRLSKFSS